MKKTIIRAMKAKAIAIIAFCLSAASTGFAQTFPSGFSQVKVATIYYPTSMDFAPDGRIFCAEKAGRIKIIKNGQVLGTPFLQVSVNQLNERGLSSVLLDPNFSVNKYVYIYYTTNTSPVKNRLSRFTANGDVAVAGSETVIFETEPMSNSIHNGGGMLFGNDGKLYLAVGNDNINSYSQDLSNSKGKILRMNPDGSVPSGNPYSSPEAAKRIWAYGLRNPWTIAKQPGTGKIFVNEVGEGSWEEINDATNPGKNFGWPNAEGNSSNGAYTNPVFTYQHGSGNTKGCAITGGTFFNPSTTNYPSQYNGKYFFIDYCNHWINYIDPTTKALTNFASNLGGALNCLRTGKDGNLYYYSISSNSLYKIVYNNSSAPQILSQPQSISVSAGQNASFNVGASGSQPLSYQWQKNNVNISGANSATYTINNVQPSNAGNYRVIVSNGFGSATSNNASLTVTAFNAKPVASIATPSSGSLYRGGDVISFSGNATDSEDGTLPASAFQWIVEFRHDNHIHPGPFIPSGIKSGTFGIAKTGEVSPNVFYRLILIVTDSDGAQDTVYRDIQPKKAALALSSQPPGLKIKLDDMPFTATHSVMAVSGMYREIGVVNPQTFNGKIYNFSHWLHGGAATQTIETTDNSQSFAAVFTEGGDAPVCSASGTILREYWSNVSGSTVGSIPLNSAPTGTGMLTSFKEPSNFGDNFGSRVRGFICAPATGNYTFWIASDNNSELWLSTTDQPEQKVKIAFVNGYTQSQEYTKYPSQQSSPVFLEEGRSYYIEALHKEGSQGDNMAVGWRLPDGTLERPIPGSRLSPFGAAPGSDISIAITSPANNSNFSAPANITLNASATSSAGISKVEFFANGSEIGEDSSSPFSVSWNSVSAGTYTLHAVATNGSNQTKSSSFVLVTVTGTANCTASGSILREYWSNISGYSVSNIPVNSVPTGTSLLSVFKEPSSFGDNYGSRVRGFICPPANGNYTFWIASDDNSELWLSTNDQPSQKVKIAYVNGYTSSEQWTKYPSQQSAPVYLTAGTRYYIEALHKEGSQGDNMAVGWQLPSGILERPIPGSRLSPYGSSSTSTSNISVAITSPADNTTYSSPANITFNAQASSANGIQKVEYFSNGAKFGESQSAPYTFTWFNVVTGTYTITAVATDNNNQTKTSLPIKIIVSGCATPTITPSGPTTMCSGSVWLHANTAAGNNYQWKKNGVDISGATSSSYNASSSGDYQVKITNGSCVGWSAPMKVTISNALSAKITPGGPLEFCSGGKVTLYANTCSGYIYQWKKDGSDIPGATASTYTATTSGSYQVKIIQGSSVAWSALANVTVNPCGSKLSAPSDSVPRTVSDDSFHLSVFPNPTSGLFSFDVCVEDAGQSLMELRVISATGQTVYSKNPTAVSGCVRESIELSGTLPTGVYILQLKVGSKVETTKIILSSGK